MCHHAILPPKPRRYESVGLSDTRHSGCQVPLQQHIAPRSLDLWTFSSTKFIINWYKRPKNYNIPFRFSHLPAILWGCQRRNSHRCISWLFSTMMLYHLQNRCRRHGVMENERRSASTPLLLVRLLRIRINAILLFGHHRPVAPAPKSWGYLPSVSFRKGVMNFLAQRYSAGGKCLCRWRGSSMYCD